MEHYKFVVSFIATSISLRTDLPIISDILTRYKTREDCEEQINLYKKSGWVLTHVSIAELIPTP